MTYNIEVQDIVNYGEYTIYLGGLLAVVLFITAFFLQRHFTNNITRKKNIEEKRVKRKHYHI